MFDYYSEVFLYFANYYTFQGYPTFWYFVGKEKKFQYHGDYTKSAFLDFLDKYVAYPRYILLNRVHLCGISNHICPTIITVIGLKYQYINYML